MGQRIYEPSGSSRNPANQPPRTISQDPMGLIALTKKIATDIDPNSPGSKAYWQAQADSGAMNGITGAPVQKTEAMRLADAAQGDYDTALKTRGDTLSEMEKLSGFLGGTQQSEGQQSLSRQLGQAQSDSSSRAAGRVGINPALAAKMRGRDLATITGRGGEGIRQQGMADYQSGLERFSGLANSLQGGDISAYSGLTQQAAGDVQRRYLEDYNKRQMALQQALQNGRGYWGKQAAIAGQPEKPGAFETVVNTAAKLAPLAVAL